VRAVAYSNGCWAERVAWFGSTRLDLQTWLAAVPAGGVAGCSHAAIDGLGAFWLSPVGSVPMAILLATEMKSP
jgi:hypothetical protein